MILLPPQGSGLEAKTRGGTLEAPAYVGNVVYSPEGKDIEKKMDFRELGAQRINETLAKDLRHAHKGLTTRLMEFTCWTSQVRVRARVNFELGSNFYLFSLIYVV